MNKSPISPSCKPLLLQSWEQKKEKKKKKPTLQSVSDFGDTCYYSQVFCNTSQWRYCGKRSVKEVRVKVESPQRSLEKEWGCKGGRVWLLDTNHLWRGAFSLRRKVIPPMLPTPITHALSISMCVWCGGDECMFACVSLWLLMGPEVLSETDSINFSGHTRTHAQVDEHRLISVRTRGALTMLGN